MPTPRALFSTFMVIGLSACFQPVPDTGLMGPAGGELESDGVILSVPPGALSMPTRLTITADTSAPPTGSRAIGAAFRLGPEGLQFAQPITLELPLTSEPSSVQIATAPTGTRQFELLPATRSGLRARAQISHFSIFIPVTPTDGPDAGADGGADAGVDAGFAGIDAGPDAGIDAGVDAGVDAGAPDAGFTGDPLEDCQSDWTAIRWWTLTFDDGGVAAISTDSAETAVVELPGAWVFTIGPSIFSIDRGTRALVGVRHTMHDTPWGGSNRVAPLRFPSELLFASGRGTDLQYTEWKMDLNGLFTPYADAGYPLRDVALPGTNPASGGSVGPSPGVSVISSWDSVAVAAGQGPSPAIGIVPRDPGLPPWTVPLPSGVTDTSAALELADGTVLFALNTNYPPLPASPLSIHTEVFALTRDGGLTTTGWTASTTMPRGLSLAGGSDGGALLITVERTSALMRSRDDLVGWTGAPDAGEIWPVPGALHTTPNGRLVALVTGGLSPPVYGANATAQDIYLLLPRRGASLTPLLQGHRSYAAPGIGGLRDDSFIFAFYDDRTTALHAARLCLPP